MFGLDYSVQKGARDFGVGVSSFVTGVHSICMGVLGFMSGAFSFKWARQVSSVSYVRVTIS